MMLKLPVRISCGLCYLPNCSQTLFGKVSIQGFNIQHLKLILTDKPLLTMAILLATTRTNYPFRYLYSSKWRTSIIWVQALPYTNLSMVHASYLTPWHGFIPCQITFLQTISAHSLENSIDQDWFPKKTGCKQNYFVGMLRDFFSVWTRGRPSQEVWKKKQTDNFSHFI